MSDTTVREATPREVRERLLLDLPQDVREALEKYQEARARLARAEQDCHDLAARYQQSQANLVDAQKNEGRTWDALVKARLGGQS